MYIWLILGFGFIFGTILGSLSKALADRSLKEVSFNGRSYCESCKHKLSWYDLFPLFSYLSTQGKCRYCHKKIGIEYPLVELTTGVLIALLLFLSLPLDFWSLPLVNQLLTLFEIILKAFTVVILIIVFLTDIKTGLIPDRITFPAVIISFFLQLFIVCFKESIFYLSTVQSALGRYLLPPQSDFYERHVWYYITELLGNMTTAIGVGLFFLLLIIITRGRGMGGGDMKLGVFLGLVLGFPLALISLMLAFLTGAVAGLGLIIFGQRKLGQTIPFGPFLSLGALLTLFWGEKILNWYINLRLN